MLQGLLISIFVGLMLIIRNFFLKKIDKVSVSLLDDKQKLLAMGSRCLRLGQYNKSIDCYNKVLSTDPYNSIALVSLSSLFFNVHKYEEANKLYEKIYNYYYNNNSYEFNKLPIDDKKTISTLMYNYGYTFHIKGLLDKASYFKDLSLQDGKFSDDYKHLQISLLY